MVKTRYTFVPPEALFTEFVSICIYIGVIFYGKSTSTAVVFLPALPSPPPVPLLLSQTRRAPIRKAVGKERRRRSSVWGRGGCTNVSGGGEPRHFTVAIAYVGNPRECGSGSRGGVLANKPARYGKAPVTGGFLFCFVLFCVFVLSSFIIFGP